MTNNKKRFCGIAIIIMMLILSVTLIACGNGGDVVPEAYSITFAGGEGSTGTAPTMENKEANATFAMPINTFTKTDYVFAGWFDGVSTYQVGDPYTMPAKGLTFTALWTGNTYTITFAGGEGAEGYAPTAIPNKAKGEEFALPINSYTKIDYVFAGWNDGVVTYQVDTIYTMRAKNVTFTALWTENTYAITFAGGEGATGTAPVIEDKAKNAVFEMPSNDYIKTGYAFAGWSDGVSTSQVGETYTMPAGEVIFTALWAELYSITFVGGVDATGTAPVIEDKAENVSFAMPSNSYTKTKHIFAGWSDGFHTYQVGDTYSMLSSNVTFTVVWAELYSITFEGGGNTGGIAPTTIPNKAMGAEFTLPINSYIKTGHVFAGWYNGYNINQEGVTYTMPGRDLTFTAVWEETYAIKFTGGEGATGNAPTAIPNKVAGSEFALPINSYTKTDYVFAGWSDGSTTYQVDTIYTMRANDVTFTVQWIEKTYAITFVGGGSTGGIAPVIEDKAKNAVFEMPSNDYIKTGYAFAGWSDENITYQEGATYTMPASEVTFTAQWKIASLTYTLINGDTEYEVTGIGTWSDTDIIIPTTYKNKSVTSIGDYAFAYCSSLTSIEIPAGVIIIGNRAFDDSGFKSITFEEGSQLTSIGESAFAGCNSLASIKIPKGVTRIGNSAFYECSLLESVTFAEGSQLTGIAGFAFNECSSLTSIDIPAGVISIDSYAFYGCSSLTSVTFAEGSQLKRISNSAFSECSSLTSITFPSTLTDIYPSAFAGCSSLTSIEIPAGVALIVSNAFTGCSSLTSIEVASANANYSSDERGVLFNKDKTILIRYPERNQEISYVIPATVTNIVYNAFDGCSSLTRVTFAEESQLTSIGDSAFNGCSGLTSIEIPAGVTIIGDSAFDGCSSLTNIEVASANANYSNDERGVLFNKDKTILIRYPERNQEISYVIPASVTSIAYRAFDGCSSLTSVTFAEGSQLTSIGDSAFNVCSGLTSIEIPAGVTIIGDSVFYGCSSLTRVTFAEKSQLTSIGDRAFEGCSSLTSIVIPLGIINIGDWAFYGCSRLTSIVIPVSVTRIGLNAFYRCSSLTTINMRRANHNGMRLDGGWNGGAEIKWGYTG